MDRRSTRALAFGDPVSGALSFRFNERFGLFPVLLAERLARIDHQMSRIILRDPISHERALRRALGDGALRRKFTSVTGAREMAVFHFQRRGLVRAAGAAGVDL